MEIRFAFAVNMKSEFEAKHFGDADKYLIYGLKNGNMVLLSEEINHFKLMDEEHEHGSQKKGLAIIDQLGRKNVNVLVSKQFGKNIKLVNRHFIPIKISMDLPDEILEVLNKHLHWIQDELENFSSGYKLFTIRSGILKTSLDKFGT